MSLKNHLVNFFKGDVPFIDVWYYVQGNYRHKLFYSKFKFLIRGYIREQISFRIAVMNKECYNNGECIKCGCATTALQMCNKMCKGLCYPSMMNKDQWDYFKEIKLIYLDEWYWQLEGDELIRKKEHWFS
jgi:hypothetical protein